MKNKIQLKYKIWKTVKISSLFLLTWGSGCSPKSTTWENVNEEGSFLVYRRQSFIGIENYSITSNKDSIIVKSLQGENERGKITGTEAELHLKMDLAPIFYENKFIKGKDTSNVLKVVVNPKYISIWENNSDVVRVTTPTAFFPLHSTIPAAMEMMLYHYYFERDTTKKIPTFPRGQVSIDFKKMDTVTIKGKTIPLERYVVKGINWGGRTIWLDKSKNLVAIVKANTQIREIIRKGYEDAMSTFIEGNVEEEMNALSEYTKKAKGKQSKITALVGGDIIDGISDATKKDMTLIIENGKIKQIGKRKDTKIPSDAEVIDVKGKVLMPGLWDMHAHSNQVQWAPAYLAGGVTTIRDLGNEVEFATTFRDAIDKGIAMGPDILLGGMTDGPGNKGNGVIRATTPEQAREVVAMYKKKGYRQIKIYNSIKPDILKILTTEAHRNGMTVTGHVPVAVGNATDAVESGMDQLNHRTLFLSVLFPNRTISELGRYYLHDTKVSPAQIQRAIEFLLKHKTVLDPTISLDIIRNLPWGTPVETVVPGVTRIAYELFEDKRFLKGVSPERAEKVKKDVMKGMEIIGEFCRAGIPIVAGTDNAVPVFNLYLEIETYCKMGKLTPLQAIQSATIVPARVMGMDSRTGTLELGKEADIAILNKNPLEDIDNLETVSAVLTNGNYFESDPLWQLAGFKSNK